MLLMAYPKNSTTAAVRSSAGLAELSAKASIRRPRRSSTRHSCSSSCRMALRSRFKRAVASALTSWPTRRRRSSNSPRKPSCWDSTSAILALSSERKVAKRTSKCSIVWARRTASCREPSNSLPTRCCQLATSSLNRRKKPSRSALYLPSSAAQSEATWAVASSAPELQEATAATAVVSRRMPPGPVLDSPAKGRGDEEGAPGMLQARWAVAKRRVVRP
mmetsp:Transcript_47783/g.137029  ORF Transcript_47783/g.137029 Transcript_47783/m.137029 type:complete len:219 (+) Transcript_47783:615-1271(+)